MEFGDDLVIGTANPQTLSHGAGGQVLLFNTVEKDTLTSINKLEALPMSVYMRQGHGYIHLASVDATKDIHLAQLFTVDGHLVASATPDRHETYLYTTNLLPAPYLLKVQIGPDTFTRKIMVR